MNTMLSVVLGKGWLLAIPNLFLIAPYAFDVGL